MFMSNIAPNSPKVLPLHSASDRLTQNLAQARVDKEARPEQANQLNSSLPASKLQFSRGQPPIPPSYCVPREQSDQLLGLLKGKPNVLIEVIGPSRVGKTTLLQNMMEDLISSHPGTSSEPYNLIAWIDCSSVGSAYADMLRRNKE